MSISLTTQSRWRIKCTLKKDAATFTITPTDTVKATMRFRGEAISAEVTCDESDSDADWVNSLVLVEFTPEETAAIATYRNGCQLEVRNTTTDNAWLIDGFNIHKGVIAH